MKVLCSHIVIFLALTLNVYTQLPPKWQYLGGDTVVQFITIDMDNYGRVWGYPVFRNEKLSKKYRGYFSTILFGNKCENEAEFPDSTGSFQKTLQVLPNGNILICDGGGGSPPSINIYNNKARKWIYKAQLPGSRHLTSVTMDKRGVLYCSSEDWLLFCSTDQGITWNAIYNPWRSITDVYIDAENNLIAKYGDGTRYQGLFRTTDYGQSWVRLDSIYFNEDIRSTVFYNFETVLTANKIYISADYEEFSRDKKMFFSSNFDGSMLDTIFHDTSLYLRIPRRIVFDSSGVMYASYRGLLTYSLDTGRYSLIKTAVVSNDPPDPSYLSGIWDTVGIKGYTYFDKYTFLINGDLHWGHHHFKWRKPDMFVPPRRMGSMTRCGYATSTFVADTLASVEFVQAGSMNVTVRYDTIVPKRSIQVHVHVIDTSKYAHFLFRAITHKGHKTEWGEDMFPKVTQTELQLRKGKTVKVPDSLDAGFAVNYVWFRNGEKLSYSDNGVFFRTERVLELSKPGNYWCEIFDTTGCVQTTAPYTHNPVSVNYDVEEQIRVFPNPANESITVTGVSEFSGNIEITDVLGNVLLVSDAKHHVSTGMMMIDVQQLPNGVYGIRIPTSKGLYRTRFVIAR